MSLCIYIEISTFTYKHYYFYAVRKIFRILLHNVVQQGKWLDTVDTIYVRRRLDNNNKSPKPFDKMHNVYNNNIYFMLYTIRD